jgi:hypothetical protein
MAREALTSAIREYLEQRRDRLSEEIRRYPTPIARCDVQLGALLEVRSEVIALLECGEGRALVEAFIATAGGWSDAEAQRLLASAS